DAAAGPDWVVHPQAEDAAAGPDWVVHPQAEDAAVGPGGSDRDPVPGASMRYQISARTDCPDC
ncbi:hypothetical protein, partial [Pseudomonas cyclaminis]|uniref:hypothetical protein n=1 Tax=Pseudomonas cyclaminis TaxID=2781239 RepID=UPI0019D67CA9